MHVKMYLSVFYLSPQRHHFAQAIAILNTVGCNIFEKFSRKVRRNFAFTSVVIYVDVYRVYVLATLPCVSRTTRGCWT